MKFYWDIRTPICLCIFCDCCEATMAELSSWSRPTKPKIYTIWPFTEKSLPFCVVEEYQGKNSTSSQIFTEHCCVLDTALSFGMNEEQIMSPILKDLKIKWRDIQQTNMSHLSSFKYSCEND